MRLFFSWQSDIPENRKIVRKALQKVCDELGIEYSDDSRNARGSHLIVDIIQRTIENSHVVIGDITPVATTANGKKLANSNVCYELGYAERVLGRDGVLMVLNQEYGEYDELPFDFGKRTVLTFKTEGGVLDEAGQKRLVDLLRTVIGKLQESGTFTNLPAGSVSLNKTEMSVLYWALHASDNCIGYVVDGLASTYVLAPVDSFSAYYREDSAGDAFHAGMDFVKKAKYERAVTTLGEKGLIALANGAMASDRIWALTDEGEERAKAITKEDVYELVELKARA